MAEAGQQSEDGHGSVEVEAGGESDRHEESEELRRRNFQDVEHW